ncbi:hypothetical protein D3C73_1482450 [compost metagenome]
MDLEGGELEHDLSCFSMSKFENDFWSRANLTLFPQTIEIGMSGFHFLKKGIVPFILHILTVISSEDC